jgi:hypothetical protein
MTAERTAKAIVAGTWGCAGIVMAGSATNAYLAYGALGDNRALGLATGLAVDIGLCVALIGDRRLYAHGLSSNWGRALRITTAVMSLILNTAIALRDGHFLSAVMHAFLPILLVVLTEYGQDVLLKFTALGRAQDDADRLPVRPLDRTGPVVLTQPAGPVRPTLTAPLAPSGVEGSAQRTASGSGPSRSGPDPLPDWSAPHPEALRMDTVTAPRGGSASQVKDPDPRSDPPDSPAGPQADSLTDEDLIRAVRDWASEEGTVPSRERVRTRYGVGSKRADRARTAALTPDHPALRAVPTGGGR